MDLIKISPDDFKDKNLEVKVEISDTIKPNEFRCDDCGNIYEKGWTDEEAAAESQQAFGITTGATVCDDCYNEIMYNRAERISATEL